MTITAIYHVKDEEEFLHRSFLSVVPWVDETIVFDTGSKDSTPDICQAWGRDRNVRYYRFEEDFATHPGGEKAFRAEAIDKARCDWILQLDGDCILSNGWRKVSEPFINDARFGFGKFTFYEHMGSYEFVHKGLTQTEIGVLFRRQENLQFIGGINASGTHGSLMPSAIPNLAFKCSAAWFHYGYTKHDMVEKLARNVGRGDWGQDQATKDDYASRINLENVWSFLPPVEPVPYGADAVPWAMRDLFGRTYKITLSEDGKVLKREKACG